MPPNLSVPNESGYVEGDNHDSNTEKYPAMKDEASAHNKFSSEGWHAQWPFDSWWNCWDYRARVPDLQPTHSGTSAATAHTCGVSLDLTTSPVRKES